MRGWKSFKNLQREIQNSLGRSQKDTRSYRDDGYPQRRYCIILAWKGRPLEIERKGVLRRPSEIAMTGQPFAGGEAGTPLAKTVVRTTCRQEGDRVENKITQIESRAECVLGMDGLQLPASLHLLLCCLPGSASANCRHHRNAPHGAQHC